MACVYKHPYQAEMLVAVAPGAISVSEAAHLARAGHANYAEVWEHAVQYLRAVKGFSVAIRDMCRATTPDDPYDTFCQLRVPRGIVYRAVCDGGNTRVANDILPDVVDAMGRLTNKPSKVGVLAPGVPPPPAETLAMRVATLEAEVRALTARLERLERLEQRVCVCMCGV